LDSSSGEDAVGSLTFFSWEEFGGLVSELRRIGLAPRLALSLLAELERYGILAEGERAVEALRDVLELRRGRQKPSELGEAVARLFLSGDVPPEGLQAAAEALHALARLQVKGGVWSSAGERAREVVARAFLPALKSHVIPKWVYTSLEKTTAQLRERATLQELELERLKALLKKSGREIPVQRLYLVSGLLEEDPLPMEGGVVRIACPICRELNTFHHPKAEACREAASRRLLFRLHCSYCGRTIDLEPERLLLMVEGGGELGVIGGPEARRH